MKRRVMKEFRIDEISLVDNPAQPKARIALMKRLDASRALTTADAGHAHSIVLSDGRADYKSGETSYELDSNGVHHSHPWMANEAGEVTIGMAAGHTHGVAMIAKSGDAELTAEEVTMEKRTFSAKERERLAQEGLALPDGSFPIVTRADLRNAIAAFGRAPKSKRLQVARHIKRRARALGAMDMLPEEGELAELLNKGLADSDNGGHNARGEVDMDELKKLQEQIEAERKRADRLEKIAALSAEERAHFDRLQESERDSFLEKSREERAADLRKAAEADPVVYTCADGTELRKSAGELTIRMAKQNDELAKKLAEQERLAKQADLEKRAAEQFANLRGDVAEKAALLGAVESIEDEDLRKKVTEMLKAHDSGLGKAFERVGSSSAPTEKSAADELDALAKSYAQENKVDLSVAYAKVLETPEGEALYNKHIGRS